MAAADSPQPQRPRPKRRRLKGPDRVAQILDAAAGLFAEDGFAGSTREIARRLEVTQALLYRYFQSKEELVDATLERAFAERWDPTWDVLLNDETIALATRLARFYALYAGGASRLRVRLWLQCALARPELGKRYGFRLSLRVLMPVVATLRREARVMDLARPVLEAERELVAQLHGAIAFLIIRRDVFGSVAEAQLAGLIDETVHTWHDGAQKQMMRLHARPAESRVHHNNN
jgi:AcrR family transcriptional regulator